MLEFIILSITTGLIILGFGMYKIGDLLERDLYSLWKSHQEILTILRKIAQRTQNSEHDNLD